jgi:D-glycero-beta-D-manno-heptose-7-phosphate kinase
MHFASIEDIFEAFNKLKVLIIGDVMVDSYLWGKVDRISPEAPVPIVHVNKRETRLGGAGNVVMNVHALGAYPVICSVIGADSDADIITRHFQTLNVDTSGIIQSPSRITTVKHRILSGSQHMLRLDQENDHPLDQEEERLLTEKIKEILPTCDVVIFEDYDKGTLTENVIQTTIELARSLNIPSIVDPKKRNFLKYKGASLFKPNFKELKEGLKVDVDPDDTEELKNAVELLKERLDLKGVLLTLSERGVYIDYNDNQKLIPAHLRSISDVSGAGDTVTGIAAACLALGLSPNFLAALSNLGGGLVCEYVGVVPINKKALLDEAKNENLYQVHIAKAVSRL